MSYKYERNRNLQSFTEDDVYFYTRDYEESEGNEDFLNKTDSENPLWFLHPSDEDNSFVKLADYIPKRWDTNHQRVAQLGEAGEREWNRSPVISAERHLW